MCFFLNHKFVNSFKGAFKFYLKKKICLVWYKHHNTAKNLHYNKEKDGEAKLNKIRAGTEVQIMF